MEKQMVKGMETEASESPLPLTCAACDSILQISEGEHAFRCTFCGQGHKFLEPPSTETKKSYELGDAVAVLNSGHWWSAHVVEPMGESRWKIHYDGWAPTSVETVGDHRIRPLDYEPGSSIIPPPPELPPIKVKRGNPWFPIAAIATVLGAGVLFYAASTKPPGTPLERARIKQSSIFRQMGDSVGTDTLIKTGQKYYVKWGETWYLGTVKSVDPDGMVLIHYDGWDDSHDSLVSRDRLRKLE